MNPLSGLLVVALEQAVAAPYCSSRLADAGARVIKIERPEGDFARIYDTVAAGQSAYFIWLNRGKESLCLNIKASEDQALLAKIIGDADVFIQNLAPGAAARAGFASTSLRATNPKLITVDISGYGETGPYKDMKAYDLLVQCETGLCSITGTAEGPGRVGVSVGDIACGMNAHSAVLEALIQRGITGQGQAIKISLFDSLADWMTVPLLHQEHTGEAPKRLGLNHPSIAPYGAYTVKDNSAIVISIQNAREWQSFCKQVLKTPHLEEDARFCDNTQRQENRQALDLEINKVFHQLTKEELITRLSSARIAYGAVNSVADLAMHPQLRRAPVDSPNGIVNLVKSPTQHESKMFKPVPALGEHSKAIRDEFS